ncbi:DUF924 family protein [Oceanomicrobium pacificus]|uniref:DUF924 family protein n=1 Tax=Oceanomicrobium pacificus TaxID=2692916 RepID=A0A6B0TMN2_9RHOB|nr:DUF924 family protein [Oceanomicrobium pacificus]MXU65777.1 DUF924 family protein [Oceanomicrobium pacificus]
MTPQDILTFWLDEVDPSNWYQSTPELDAEIRDRFMPTWEAARDKTLDGWKCRPDDVLAMLIVLDQFPRNMFRDDARAFSTDAQALALAKKAITHGLDMKVEGPRRQFYYMPLMHSENLTDQDLAVRLFTMNMPDGNNVIHAKVHREIIRRFGRFPYRNAALGRTNSAEEQAFLDGPGYKGILDELSA